MVLSREDLYIHLSVLINEVMKNGWATLTFCVTSHNFSSLIFSLFTVLFTAYVGFF